MLVINRNRKIPRPFTFEGIGKGNIEEEAPAEYEDWASVIQILRFTDGERKNEEVLRFCYYVKSGKLARRALWIDDEEVKKLRQEIQKKPRVRKFLQRLLSDDK